MVGEKLHPQNRTNWIHFTLLMFIVKAVQGRRKDWQSRGDWGLVNPRPFKGECFASIPAKIGGEGGSDGPEAVG